MAKNILIDTGFWYALYDNKDQYHIEATNIYDLIKGSPEYLIVIPFPSLYETLHTGFTKESSNLQSFKDLLNCLQHDFIYDEKYRDKALNRIFNKHELKSPSLVDLIIQEIIEDKSQRIDGLITFNERDFGYLCQINQVEILL